MNLPREAHGPASVVARSNTPAAPASAGIGFLLGLLISSFAGGLFTVYALGILLGPFVLESLNGSPTAAATGRELLFMSGVFVVPIALWVYGLLVAGWGAYVGIRRRRRWGGGLALARAIAAIVELPLSVVGLIVLVFELALTAPGNHPVSLYQGWHIFIWIAVGALLVEVLADVVLGLSGIWVFARRSRWQTAA